MRIAEELSNEDIVRYTMGVLSVGVRPKISQYRMLQYANSYRRGDYSGIMDMLAYDIGLQVRVSIQFVGDDFPYLMRISVADSPVPTYDAGRESIAIRIRKSMCAYAWEIFIATLVHEFSRMLLHSLNHPLCSSEIAVDVCSLVLGFGPVMEQGFEKSRVIRAGHIPRSQFRLASNIIESRRRVNMLREACFVSF